MVATGLAYFYIDGTSTLSAALKVDPREELLTEEQFAELARRRAKTSEVGGHKRRGSTAMSVSSDSEVRCSSSVAFFFF